MPTKINPKKAVESAAPALNTSQHHTHSSALHSIYFAGDLQPWPGFLSAVQACHENHAWRQQTLGYTLRSRDPYTYGNVEVGDEHGVQGRFQKFFGDVLNTIFASQSTTQRNIDLRFADFKCVSSTYSGTPDVILKDSNHALKIVGELKAPWINEHHIKLRHTNEDLLREILAQPIMYMKDLGCIYSFLSTCEETIFLRQIVNNNGIWRVEYSPVVLSSTTYDRLMPTHDHSPCCFREAMFLLCGSQCVEPGTGQQHFNRVDCRYLMFQDCPYFWNQAHLSYVQFSFRTHYL